MSAAVGWGTAGVPLLTFRLLPCNITQIAMILAVEFWAHAFKTFTSRLLTIEVWAHPF